jgi:hypothetical protein
MTREHIQHAIDIIYNQIFNQGRADLLPGLVSGPYIQQNPLFPNGLDGIIAYIKQAGSIPCEVKRVAIDDLPVGTYSITVEYLVTLPFGWQALTCQPFQTRQAMT